MVVGKPEPHVIKPVELSGDFGPQRCTSENLFAHLHKGIVCTMPAEAVLDPRLMRLSLDTLSSEQGDVEIVRVLSAFMKRALQNVPRSEWPADNKFCVDDPNPTMRKFVNDLRGEQGFVPDTGYTGCDGWRKGDGCLRGCYGNINAKMLRGMDGLDFPLFSFWSYVFNFVWIGWSAGGLHYDDMDNVLAQTEGTKEIVIFPPHVTDLLDGGHYPTKFDSREFFSEAAAATTPTSPALLPHYRVSLKPGMAVAIPSRAYHAPLATSYDSVSVNSFLAPSILRFSFPNFWMGNFFSLDGARRYLGAWLGYYYKWFGLIARPLKVGHYVYL